jgi:Skp family chaperone for outer membrane proteins
MKRINSFFVLMFTVAILAVSASAQATGTRFGFVDLNAFEDEKAGITRLVNANRALVLEFQPAENELNTIRTKLQGLAREIQTLNEALQRGNPPVDKKTLDDKTAEYEKLLGEGQAKQEQLQQRAQERQAAVVGPIFQEVRVALNEFAKQRGFSAILNREAVLGLGDDKLDVTKDFITFFNARPAAAAAPAPAR